MGLGSNYQSDLILLMRLKAGLLSADHQDEQLKRRWKRLRKNWKDSETALDEPDEWVDPESVAAFVEQRMAADDARQMEAAAWKSPQLLREIAATFQFRLLDATPESELDLRAAVISRLNGQLTPPAKSSVTPPPQAVPNPEVTAPPVLSEINPDVAHTDQGDKTNWKLLTALAVTILIALVGLSWLAITVATSDIARPETEPDKNQLNELVEPDSNPDIDSELVKNPDDVEPVKIEPDSDAPGLYTPFGKFDDMQIAEDDFDLDNDPFAPPPDTDKEPDNVVVENDSSSRIRHIYQPIKPTWERLEGLVAVRDQQNDEIVGYNYVSQLNDTMSIITMPGSWMNGQADGLGELIVDANSTFKIGKTSRMDDDANITETINIELQGGRFGIKELPENTNLAIKSGNVRWPVAVTEADTSLAVEYFPGSAVLFVRRGEVASRMDAANVLMNLRRCKLGVPLLA